MPSELFPGCYVESAIASAPTTKATDQAVRCADRRDPDCCLILHEKISILKLLKASLHYVGTAYLHSSDLLGNRHYVGTAYLHSSDLLGKRL